MIILNFFKFIKLEQLGGILLLLAALAAVVFENTSLAVYYEAVRDFPVLLKLGDFTLSKPLYLWVNDGLMAIFFLLVGLELKREVLDGQLSSKEQVILPMCAAIGGIVFPALIFLIFNYNNPENINGWAIPAATDIAFVLGILTLFGKRVPLSLKIFLTAVAIFDDIAAILIIAFFYTSSLSITAFYFTAFFLVLLLLLNKFKIKAISPYCIVGILLWASVLKSGIHATLAGVVLAMFIPLKNEIKGTSPLKVFEHSLHPWVAYLVLPLFAFINAGVSLKGVNLDSLMQPLTLGIICGLFFGKQIGVYGGALLAIKMGISKMPKGCSWLDIYAASLLSGIGFTMSLFIGSLAFEGINEINMVRLGVLVASLISGILAILVLLRSLNKKVNSS